ncbi:MAG: PTS IIA-like nitrogen regulatory protein PtsN [Pseudomonadota bacterium]|nr:PTS IIA-like nitrogen regulatory protein PtsN [Pseudomonadota bacterium]
MEIVDILSPEYILANLKVTSKKHALQELSKFVSSKVELLERDILETLLERERLGSTGVGNGIAIPHGKIESLSGLIGFFARLERPIDFEAIDEHPVDLIFLLLAPESAGADHLKALALISRLMRNQPICNKLRLSDNSEAIHALLTDNKANQAA